MVHYLILYSDLLFLLDCDVDVYADESTLSETGASVREIGEKLTENCRKVSSWMASNKFKLNADKTHLLVVGTKERLRNTDQPAVYMDGLQLEEDPYKCELLLGAEIEGKKVIEKLKTRLIGLNKLRFIVPYDTKKNHLRNFQFSSCILLTSLWG